jgi:GT2 family glycosyltransferase
LSAYLNFFANNPTIWAAGGPVEPVYETAEPKWMSHYTKRLITGYVNKGKKLLEYTDGSYPGGGNCAFRREVFAKIGQFNVDLGRKGNSLVGAEEKDIFDKIQSMGGRYFYLPAPVLYHIIPESKLTNDYFYRITSAIGVSERKRTQAISRWKYFKRLIAEGIKWGATFLLFIVYLLKFQSAKGMRLILFRWNVTKGLLGK